MRLVKQGSSVDTEICKLRPAQRSNRMEEEEDAKATRANR